MRCDIRVYMHLYLPSPQVLLDTRRDWNSCSISIRRISWQRIIMQPAVAITFTCWNHRNTVLFHFYTALDLNPHRDRNPSCLCLCCETTVHVSFISLGLPPWRAWPTDTVTKGLFTHELNWTAPVRELESANSSVNIGMQSGAPEVVWSWRSKRVGCYWRARERERMTAVQAAESPPWSWWHFSTGVHIFLRCPGACSGNRPDQSD